MLLFPRARKRPFHFGPYPLETLPRDDRVAEREAARMPGPARAERAPESVLLRAAERYREVYARFAEGEVAPARAPVPAELEPRVADLKGAAYFLDASQVGICRIPERAWLGGSRRPGHAFALVVLVEHPRLPEPENLAYAWSRPAAGAVARMRAAEISAVLAMHLRCMGFSARAHLEGGGTLELEKLVVLAGLGVRGERGVEAPFLGSRYSAAAVSTEYELGCDRPLRRDALKAAAGLRYWWSVGGAQSGRERARRARRATHLSRYPMEALGRVQRPTTLVLDDEVPRVPKRAAFFQRALHGDLGERSKLERRRFAYKTPFSFSLLQPIRALVPLQDGAVAGAAAAGFGDAEANARAIKSLSYLLGSDLTAICEVPRYAWYSHREDGSEILPYHRYAVVMLIDQGYDTMEGASGDDWISGAQSMRAYLRGAEIAGVMAEFLRANGYPARPQTNADSDVLHIPLVLWAGLGEMSRIGELVLNPFVGPRFKSVVLTTDLPLETDRPVDFGLQAFCGSCRKCARECPCDAIPFGDKVMFNGYETWKPDVERCTRYRITNVKGSACGRCMKMCPLNKVVDADGALLIRAASWFGVHARWAKRFSAPVAAWLDDALGHGRRNPAKKWWFDHEWIDGVGVAPPRGTNRRDLDRWRRVDPAAQKIAFYPASMMPPPDEPGPVALDRKAALAAAALLETPAQASARRKEGGAMPAHYRATPPRGAASKGGAGSPADSPYKV